MLGFNKKKLDNTKAFQNTLDQVTEVVHQIKYGLRKTGNFTIDSENNGGKIMILRFI